MSNQPPTYDQADHKSGSGFPGYLLILISLALSVSIYLIMTIWLPKQFAGTIGLVSYFVIFLLSNRLAVKLGLIPPRSSKKIE